MFFWDPFLLPEGASGHVMGGLRTCPGLGSCLAGASFLFLLCPNKFAKF